MEQDRTEGTAPDYEAPKAEPLDTAAGPTVTAAGGGGTIIEVPVPE